ncbi:MAG: ABC transporter ATP-binding protein, partial [Firmicutes bacterium]|nr:ABC transporter ATP-binding protein [Bacillota bacterium]
NMVAGFEFPSTGSIHLDNQPIKDPGPDRAVVFQQPALFPWMTVFDNIGFGLSLRDRTASSSQQEKITAMITAMGLEGFADHFPYQLSGGMQQRVAIARALIIEPSILLMDEPFGALDAQTRTDMQKFLLATWEKIRPTVLFITHDVDEAVWLADRVIVMSPRPGTLMQDLSIHLPRPRRWSMTLTPEFLSYKKDILHILRPLEETE